MSNKITLQDFRFNTMSMLNILQDIENTYPSGVDRDKAYSQVGIDLGLGADAFSDLA